jgi:plasmid stabilization system protein ParE
MQIIFSPEARLEFDEAERYYHRQASYLGKEFRKEVLDTLPRLRNWPLACPIELGEIRRLYSVELGYIYVIAVAHQHREPNYWIERINPP